MHISVCVHAYVWVHCTCVCTHMCAWVCAHLLSNSFVWPSLELHTEGIDKHLIGQELSYLIYPGSPVALEMNVKILSMNKVPTSEESSVTISLQSLISCFKMANSCCSQPDLRRQFHSTLLAWKWCANWSRNIISWIKFCGNKSDLSKPSLLQILEKLQTLSSRFILGLQADLGKMELSREGFFPAGTSSQVLHRRLLESWERIWAWIEGWPQYFHRHRWHQVG